MWRERINKSRLCCIRGVCEIEQSKRENGDLVVVVVLIRACLVLVELVKSIEFKVYNKGVEGNRRG